jgi:hypothetical protein
VWLIHEEIGGVASSLIYIRAPGCDHHFSHQEDFYSFATLSLDPEELRESVKKAHGVDWDPQKVGDAFSRQAVFIGIYDGYVLIFNM